MSQVSIIIPVYNAEKCILNAINSVLNQKITDLELIVVDDGSIDNTKRILDPLIKEGKIKYLFKDNGGAASARNFGIQEAIGKYIGFLDADDIYLTGIISECLRTIEEYNYDLVSVDNYMVYFDKHEVIKKEVQCFAWIDRMHEDNFCKFLKYGAIGGVHKAIFRRNVFERVGILDTTLPVYEDLDLWIRIAKHGLKWGHISKPLLECNRHGPETSLFTRSKKLNMDCRRQILKRYKKDGLERCPNFRHDYGELFWNLGRSYIIEHKSFREAFVCFWTSIEASPNLKRVVTSLLNFLNSKFS